MTFKSILGVLLLVASAARAVVNSSPYPSNPITIVGMQGRPIPNCVVTVTDLAGIPQTVYNDPIGSAFPGVVPPTTILQFFTVTPGEWIVTAQGEGLTKRFYTTSGVGVGPGANLTSVDRTAEVLVADAQAHVPILICDQTQFPCYWQMDPQLDEHVSFDFIMPSFPMTLTNFLFSYFLEGGADPTATVWEFDWCTYAVGEIACMPSGAHVTSFSSTATVSSARRADVTSTLITATWAPQDHVVAQLTHKGSMDSWANNLGLWNIRLEFTK